MKNNKIEKYHHLAAGCDVLYSSPIKKTIIIREMPIISRSVAVSCEEMRFDVKCTDGVRVASLLNWVQLFTYRRSERMTTTTWYVVSN
jgi:hypothetical protein